MGGVPNKLHGLASTDVAAPVNAAIREMNGRWLLLAPDRSIEPGMPRELLLAARAAVAH